AGASSWWRAGRTAFGCAGTRGLGGCGADLKSAVGYLVKMGKAAWGRRFPLPFSLLWMAFVARADSNAPVFEKDILPIFTEYCFTCHGQSSPKLGLDLRSAATTLRGSHNGPVIVKGSPEKSLLFQKVSARVMPPAIY